MISHGKCIRKTINSYYYVLEYVVHDNTASLRSRYMFIINVNP